MELKEAIQYALEGKAILFAGSGFSHGATNFRGEKFKTGIGLRNSLAKSCGIDAKECKAILISEESSQALIFPIRPCLFLHRI